MYDLITILGPTASGKTQFAAALADRLDAEIISADSRQVYRGMDIGTGKDLADYTVGSHRIPYHLIDIADAGSKYNLYQYQTDFLKAYNDIRSRGRRVILCGGSGLYLESIIKGYRLVSAPENPELRKSLEGKSLAELTEILKGYKELHNTTDVDTAKRAIRAIEIEECYRQTPVSEKEFPSLSSLTVGIDIDRDLRRQRITDRLEARLQEGMIEEVQRLLDNGVNADDLISYGLEYRYVTLYLTGKLELRYMKKELEVAIHQFAKRQMTWFRGMEKRGTHIEWIPFGCSMEQKIAFVENLLSKENNEDKD
ncbi:MAG: tRNA (adenosine(37)-N6)-dimethylallyltransferase MiaA [Bacteroidaceae bacterium]|nr:tRNA (adenosine(37)-N6)-dimethylallyltransferase MiaA [Bacteroidaceae bacterium]